MISEKLFKTCVTSIINMSNLSDKLYDDTKGSISFFDCSEIQSVSSSLQKLVSYCIDDKYNEYVGTMLDYYLYDLDCGRVADPIINDNGKEYRLETVDDLWNYFSAVHPEIVDHNYVDAEDIIRTYSDEEIEKIITTFDIKGGNY